MGKTKSIAEVPNASPEFNDGIEIEKLHFDPMNPRFPKSLRGISDERRILDWMVPTQNIVELISSMAESGFFPGEPLLVAPDGKGGFIVVEGNRRLAAAKLLAKPSDAPSRKQSVLQAAQGAKHQVPKIPVLIYPNRDQILEYLGYRHITGIKVWDPLAKAEYLKQLFDLVKQRDKRASDMTIAKELASIIGSNASYVARLLTGLNVFKAIVDWNFFDIPGLDEESIQFSILTTAVSYTNIAKYIGIDDASGIEIPGIRRPRLKELTAWSFQRSPEGTTRLGDSRHLKLLNKVVAKHEALEAFKQGYSLLEASDMTEAPAIAFGNNLDSARRKLLQAQVVALKVKSFNEADSTNLEDISSLANHLKVIVSSHRNTQS